MAVASLVVALAVALWSGMTNLPPTFWHQTLLSLPPKPRGFHLITAEVVRAMPELKQVGVGLLQLQLLHTSASLALSENASPAVRRDFERFFSEMVPESYPHFEHTEEGPDDMPAHIKAALLGAGLTVPVSAGKLLLGRWQGIYLCEHRERGGAREMVLTLQGQR